MRKITIGILGLFLLSQGPLVSQENGLERVREELPAPAAERVQQMVDEAEEDGIPTQPLIDKALEGAAKGVPSDQVIGTLVSYADRLRRAHEILGAPEDPATSVAGADALQRGVSSEAIVEVNERAGEGATVALVVLGDLVETGVPVQQATQVVGEALAGERGEEALLSIPSAVRRLVREGTPPGPAAAEVARTFRGDGPPSDLPGRGPPDSRGAFGGSPAGGPPHAPPVPPGSGPPDLPPGGPPAG